MGGLIDSTTGDHILPRMWTAEGLIGDQKRAVRKALLEFCYPEACEGLSGNVDWNGTFGMLWSLGD